MHLDPIAADMDRITHAHDQHTIATRFAPTDGSCTHVRCASTRMHAYMIRMREMHPDMNLFVAIRSFVIGFARFLFVFARDTGCEPTHHLV